jgi:hypothetical protein
MKLQFQHHLLTHWCILIDAYIRQIYFHFMLLLLVLGHNVQGYLCHMKGSGLKIPKPKPFPSDPILQDLGAHVWGR